jgi:hypothetical protein
MRETLAMMTRPIATALEHAVEFVRELLQR